MVLLRFCHWFLQENVLSKIPHSSRSPRKGADVLCSLWGQLWSIPGYCTQTCQLQQFLICLIKTWGGEQKNIVRLNWNDNSQEIRVQLFYPWMPHVSSPDSCSSWPLANRSAASFPPPWPGTLSFFEVWQPKTGPQRHHWRSTEWPCETRQRAVCGQCYTWRVSLLNSVQTADEKKPTSTCFSCSMWIADVFLVLLDRALIPSAKHAETLQNSRRTTLPGYPYLIEEAQIKWEKGVDSWLKADWEALLTWEPSVLPQASRCPRLYLRCTPAASHSRLTYRPTEVKTQAWLRCIVTQRVWKSRGAVTVQFGPLVYYRFFSPCWVPARSLSLCFGFCFVPDSSPKYIKLHNN